MSEADNIFRKEKNEEIPMSERKQRYKAQALPADLQDTIRNMVTAGQATYDEITEHVRGLGADISRSAIARFGKHVLRQQQELETASSIARELLEIAADGADLTEIASRLVAAKLLAILLQNDIYLDGDDLSLAELINIGRAVATLQAAALQRDKYLREAAERAREAADSLARDGEQSGLSDATVDAIRRRVLGLGELLS